MIALAAALAALVAAAPARAAVDFDQGVKIAPVLESLRSAAPLRALDNIWNTTDRKTVVLKPGDAESAYVDMTSVIYHDVCVTPSPWTGPICHPEPMFTDSRRFKLVLTAPIPASWGPVTFRIGLDALRGKQDLTIKADGTHAFTYALPGEFEDQLKVTPVGA